MMVMMVLLGGLRLIRKATTGAGFAFSIPYLYNGMQFAGVPEYVACADVLNITGNCAGLIFCALDGTTHIDEILSLNPDFSIVSAVGKTELYRFLREETCNVIAGEQYIVAESVVREYGYDAAFAMGTKVWSKEPLALVTRLMDPQWSDFVNWVLESLIAAEEQGITSATAKSAAPEIDVFGNDYRGMARNAVGTVGNYGEIYERHLAPILLDRPIPDKINRGNSGLIYALPFGNITRPGPGPTPNGTLAKVLARGKLICGIRRSALFAMTDTNDMWYGAF
jgi:general L-amino acid transport system substrate-binding protein